MNTALRIALRRQLQAIGDQGPGTRSWWRETPWSEIESFARASMSAEEFGVWLKLPHVVERSKQLP